MTKPVAYLGLLLALPALLVQPAVAQVTPDAQEPALSRAITAMGEGHPQEAIAAVDPVLAAYEQQYLAEKRTLYCGFSSEETLLYMLMAATEKKDAVALTPNWCIALFVKGYSLNELKQTDEGRIYLERAVAMAPSHAHYPNELGYVYQEQRNWQGAYDVYARAADAAPLALPAFRLQEQTRAWRGMGFVLVEMGKWDDAADMYRRCLKANPRDTKAQAELDWIAEQRKTKT